MPPQRLTPKHTKQRAVKCCDQCRTSKIGCDRSHPCNSCYKRKVDCSYTSGQQTPSAETTGRSHDRPDGGSISGDASLESREAGRRDTLPNQCIPTLNSAAPDPGRWRSMASTSGLSTYTHSSLGNSSPRNTVVPSSGSTPPLREQDQELAPASGQELFQPTTITRITGGRDARSPSIEQPPRPAIVIRAQTESETESPIVVPTPRPTAPDPTDEDKEFLLRVTELRNAKAKYLSLQQERKKRRSGSEEVKSSRKRLNEAVAREMRVKQQLMEIRQEREAQEEKLRADEKRDADEKLLLDANIAESGRLAQALFEALITPLRIPDTSD